MAKSAGHIEFKNLPGQIITGCKNTPAYKSRYCSDHKPPPNEGDRVSMITKKKCTRAGIYYQVLSYKHVAIDSKLCMHAHAE